MKDRPGTAGAFIKAINFDRSSGVVMCEWGVIGSTRGKLPWAVLDHVTVPVHRAIGAVRNSLRNEMRWWLWTGR